VAVAAAGKSSLIASMRRLAGTTDSSSGSSSGSSSSSTAAGDPTIAPIPGTTLGLLQVSGVPLGPKHRVFDTPGVPHPYQLTSRLNLRELAAVLPRRRLKPRTYCVPVGNSILVGGFARLDVVSGPSANIYVTVFVSDEIVTHMGKTAGAEERLQKHVGGLLLPPYEPERLQELALLPRTALVEGSSWKESSRDIAIAGGCVVWSGAVWGWPGAACVLSAITK
jgi:ribosome biogenesis GTPase A